jgi:hypothetical protein
MLEYMNDIVNPPDPTDYSILPGQSVLITGSDGPLAKGANFCLVWDFFTDTDINVWVTFGASVNFAFGAPFDPTHTRGTFPGMNVDKTLSATYVVPGPSGIYKTIPVGAIWTSVGGTSTYREGSDWTIVASPPPPPYPVPRVNANHTADYGIFGMLYSIEVPLSNSAAYPVCVGVVLNARGDGEGLDGIVADVGGPNSPTVVFSTGRYGAGHDNDYQGMIVSKDQMAPGSALTKRFFFMYPSGSSSPTQFVIVPFSGYCSSS